MERFFIRAVAIHEIELFSIEGRRFLRGSVSAHDAVEAVDVTDGEAAPSLEEARLAAESQARESLRRSPLVEAAFAAFPGAELIEEEAASPSRGGPGERNWSRRA